MSAEMRGTRVERLLIGMLQWGRALMSAEMPPIAAAGRPPPPLQWGRALMSAEMARPPQGCSCRRVASMGPRSDERGNGNPPYLVDAVTLASMGPRSDERGNLGQRPGVHRCDLASMGPRSDERGNSPACHIGCNMKMLQWGRALMSAEMACVPTPAISGACRGQRERLVEAVVKSSCSAVGIAPFSCTVKKFE